MTRPNPWIFAPGAVALLVFAGYAVIWNKGAGEMRKAVTTWTEDVREGGGQASFVSFRARGFPFLLRGVVRELTISGAGWSWSAPTLYIDASPFNPTRLIFSARDPHVLALGGGSWRIDAADARASIARDAARGWLLDIESGPGRIDSLDGGRSIAAQSFLLSSAPNAVDASRVFFGVDARGVVSSGATIDRAELAFAVDGLLGAKSLRGWRDAGGRVDVQRLRILANGAEASVAGQLVLDGEGYPSGTLRAEIANPAPFAELLRAAGVLPAEDEAKAAAALTLAALAGGGKIAAPLTLEERAARIAGVKVAALPQVLQPAQP